MPHNNNPRISGFTAGCVLVSNVIGGGIFTATGFMARDLGDPWLILTLWVLGALFALAGALSYSEMAAAMPRVGGEYIYITEAYGPLLGYLSGWASFTIGFGAAIAAASASFAAYVLQLVPDQAESAWAPKAIACMLLWGLTTIHLGGVEAGGWAQRVLTITKAGAILLLAVGAFLFGHGDWGHLTTAASPVREPGFGAIAVSFVFVIYAYSGWNAVGYIAGEIRNPSRTIPGVLAWGTAFVAFVYLTLNAVYFYALPIETLAQPPILPVAEKAAVSLFGTGAARLITLLLCLSIAAAVSAMVWAGPRVYYAMAIDGRIPSRLARRAESGAPSNAIVLQTAWATVLILSGTFEQLVVYTGVILGTFSALGVGAVMILRRTQPSLPRPYRVPFYPIIPAAYIAAAAAVVLYTIIERPTEAVLGYGTVLAGVPFYWLGRKRADRLRPS